MDLTFRQLALIVAIDDHGSLSRAAASLGLTQPAASMQLQRTQHQLDVELVERSGRQLALTLRGRRIAGHARRLLDSRAEFDAVVEGFRREDAGVMRVGCLAYGAGLIMTPILRRFTERRPDLRIERSQASLDNHLAGLSSGDVDVAFGFGPIEDEAVDFRVLFQDTTLVAIPNDNVLARRAVVDVEDIIGLPILGDDGDGQAWQEYWLALAYRDGRAPDVAGRLRTVEMHLEAVAMGRGISIVSRQTALLYHWSGVAFVRLRGVPPVPHWIAWRRGNAAAAVQELVECAAEVSARSQRAVAGAGRIP